MNNVDGQFVPATTMRGAVLVFIADLMQRWTSDRYKSVVSLKNNTDLYPLIKNITTIHARLIHGLLAMTKFLWNRDLEFSCIYTRV